MKKLIKIILTYTLKPYLKYVYLTSDRKFRYDNLSLEVTAGVFHPGLFYSSKMFCDFIKTLPIKDLTLLDLGTGSGILALVSATRGAIVTAVDINPSAVVNTRRNAELNQLKINCFQSNLFSEIGQSFDYIIANPPYYPKRPDSDSEHAWYCGSSHEYFQHLFKGLANHSKLNTHIFLIMSDECDLVKIEKIANDNGYCLNIVFERKFWLEKNFIFEVSRQPAE
ncbi:methyltransferase [Aliikangiella sp. IMCC44359]|uniref:methyltransferase n=1 Tax=Aliikangiella sp. IMCC44359 TaxID=3459125 RepID=UPI00403AFAB2